MVYAADKQQRRLKTHGTEHQEKRVANAGVVAEEEGRLQEASHIRMQVEVYTVAEHEDSC